MKAIKTLVAITAMLMFVCVACETDPQDEDLNPGQDIYEPDPDTSDEDTYEPPECEAPLVLRKMDGLEMCVCPDDLVQLELNGVVECVTEEFHFYATEVLTGTWIRVEPDDQKKMDDVAAYHISYAPNMKEKCPTTNFITGLFGPVNTLCLESDLSLSLCKNDATPCDGEKILGEISKSDNEYYVNFTTSNDLGDQDWSYKKISE